MLPRSKLWLAERCANIAVTELISSQSAGHPRFNASHLISSHMRTSNERKLIVDSRASLHLMSKNELVPDEEETIRKFKDPTIAEYVQQLKTLCLRTCMPVEICILHSRMCQQLQKFPFWQLSCLNLIHGSLFAFPDGLSQFNFGVPLAVPSSPPFPSPFEFRCGDACLGWFMRECVRIAKWTLHFRDPTSGASSVGVVFGIVFTFLFGFSVCSVPLQFLLEMCWSDHLQCATVDRMSSLYRRRATHNFNSSDFAICVMDRLSHMLSVSLSVTADNTSCHLEAKDWTLSFSTWTSDNSRVQDGFIVATNFEEVVDHSSNLSARKWSLLRLNCSFGCGDLLVEISC